MAVKNEDPDRGAPTVPLTDEEGVRAVVVESVFALWKVVNDLTRLRPSRRRRFRVTVFGSARVQPGTLVYDEVKRFARGVTELGCEIVTGGGPGLMQAANEGANTARDDASSVGIRVELPFEQQVNPFVGQAFEHQTFFTRLHHFALVSDAFVVVPGGIGTVLEATMVWQLLQVGHMRDVPLILVGKMWRGLVDWAREQMLAFDPPMASAADLAIPRCLDTADEAIAAIREVHIRWLAADVTREVAGSSS